MAIYGITDDGFVLKPLAVIIAEINDAQRADIDPGLDLDARSAQGQVNQIIGGTFAELWELGQASYNAAYPDSSSAVSLDNVSSITGTSRSPTTKTLVPAVNVTMNPNKALPVGSVAHLTGQPNARFLTLTEVVATAGGGVFAVDFEAESAGAIAVAIGQLSSIAEPVDGWVAVSNPGVGTTGEETETDAELRVKRLSELEGGGSTNIDSIRANLLQDVVGVVDASVFENVLDVVAGGLLPHSIRAVLRGGAPADIAQSLFDTKAGGISTNGAQSFAVLDSQGNNHTIKWDDATDQNYFLSVTVNTNPDIFDGSSGPAAMKDAVAAYVNALVIGGDVLVDQVKCALLIVDGTLSVPVFSHGVGAPSQSTDLLIAQDDIAVSDVANITIIITP